MSSIDLNNSQCIQTVNNIGNNVYKNICDGTSHVVSWGTSDWLTFWVVAAIASIICLVIIAGIVIAVWDR